jgi:hypothetical protein
MARTLRVLFRRDPSRDRHDQDIPFEGYQVLWPDGFPVAVGFDAFCKHGQRLMGLGRHLAGCPEKLVDMMCFPLADREDDLTRLPGARVRRFCLRRTGHQGRIHFLDGTPTAIVFDLDSDEERVLRWIGLGEMRDGQECWLDLAARPADTPAPPGFTLDGACPAPV